MMRILIVEDEQAIALGLKFNFEQEGYEAIVAGDGPAALRLFRDANPPIDLIVLDLMLPGMSGYETCTAIRERDQFVPIIILSARMLSEDRAHAFDCGTDQYLTKPFALPELLSRVRNLLEKRKTLLAALEGKSTSGDSVREFNGVRVDPNTFELTVRGESHRLTTLEMQLLKYFLDHEGKVLSRAELLENVWSQSAEVSTRTVDNFVVRLRRLIEPDPSRPRYIESVRGTGYRFTTAGDPGDDSPPNS